MRGQKRVNAQYSAKAVRGHWGTAAICFHVSTSLYYRAPQAGVYWRRRTLSYPECLPDQSRRRTRKMMAGGRGGVEDGNVSWLF